MPPASPVPGWSSGDVCTLTIATRRTASSSLSATLLSSPARNTGPNRSNRAAPSLIPGAGRRDDHDRRHNRSVSRRTAVVTGASSGIGAATARALAQQGYAVWCAARRSDRIQALAEEIGGTAVTCDVTSPESVAGLAAEVGDSLNVLVNNAGGAFGLAPVAEADPEDWRRMFDVNVLGLLHVTQALLPALQDERRRADRERRLHRRPRSPTRAVPATPPPSTAPRWSPRPCDSSWWASRSGSARSLPAWCGPTSSLWSASRATRPAPTRSTPGWPSRSWPRTSPTRSPGSPRRPPHVNIDELVIKPRAQAAQHKVHRV